MSRKKEKRNIAFFPIDQKPYYYAGRIIDTLDDGMVVIFNQNKVTIVQPSIIIGFKDGLERLNMLNKFINNNTHVTNPIYTESLKLVAKNIILHANRSVGM